MSYCYHPNHFNSESIIEQLQENQACIDGRYVPARPFSCPSLAERIRYAWWVLTGQADVITWRGQP